MESMPLLYRTFSVKEAGRGCLWQGLWGSRTFLCPIPHQGSESTSCSTNAPWLTSQRLTSQSPCLSWQLSWVENQQGCSRPATFHGVQLAPGGPVPMLSQATWMLHTCVAGTSVQLTFSCLGSCGVAKQTSHHEGCPLPFPRHPQFLPGILLNPNSLDFIQEEKETLSSSKWRGGNLACSPCHSLLSWTTLSLSPFLPPHHYYWLLSVLYNY